MKRNISLILVAMIALTIIPQAFAITKFANIEVTMINQEPDPVSPGNSFDVRFRIENTGSDPANNVEVKIVSEYPISAYGGEDMTKNIGTLTFSTGGQDYGVVEKWKLFADPNAATGTSKIELWYRVDTGSWTKAGEYDVTIRSQNPFLAINQIKTDPERIIPGTATKVSFFLDNMADNELRDITLKLDFYNTESGTSTELPFTPIGSGNEKTLGRIAKGKSEELSFDLFTDATAASKVYKVPYTMLYSDTSGTNFTRTGVLGLLVDSDPDLSVYIEKSEATTAGSTGKVTVKLVNKGFSDIKFLDIKLNEGNGFKLLSTPEVYVGKLDSDDYETADYTIKIDSNAKDHVTLPIRVDYRDANGHLYKKEVPLNLKVYTQEEIKEKNGSSNNTFWMLLIVVAIGIAAVYVYRRIRTSSRKKA